MLNVATSSSGDLLMTEDNIFCGAPSKSTHDAGLQLSTGHQHLFLIGREPSEALSLTARNQCDFLNRVVILDQSSDQSMADLVVGDQSLAASISEWTTLHAGNDSIDGVVDFAESDRFLAAAGCEDRGFIHQVGQISTCETGSASSNAFE